MNYAVDALQHIQGAGQAPGGGQNALVAPSRLLLLARVQYVAYSACVCCSYMLAKRMRECPTMLQYTFGICQDNRETARNTQLKSSVTSHGILHGALLQHGGVHAALAHDPGIRRPLQGDSRAFFDRQLLGAFGVRLLSRHTTAPSTPWFRLRACIEGASAAYTGYDVSRQTVSGGGI